MTRSSPERGTSSFSHVIEGLGTPVAQQVKEAVVVTNRLTSCGSCVITGGTIGSYKSYHNNNNNESLGMITHYYF